MRVLEDFITAVFMITNPLCANINLWSLELFFHMNSIYHYLFYLQKYLMCVFVGVFIPNFPYQTSIHSLSNQLRNGIKNYDLRNGLEESTLSHLGYF